ncbi:hypothetical protein [Lysinibacillus pakistanensis]|uniref:Uncharacterized protein n=1 Tax=Lysinibacillus pakistanensis TaxID=759811 RepID=A0ABX6D9L5_9BACI|nr:hypothetical protein GDS87_11215 [Lysinibacillus pakistanensis]
MMLNNDSKDAKVITLVDTTFPKGTEGTILTSAFVEGTTMRVYCIQTNEEIKGLVSGLKSEWYFERDLKYN